MKDMRLSLTLIAAMMLASIAVFALCGCSSAADANDYSTLQVNAKGQTYGSLIDPKTGQMREVPPVLKSVKASNGQDGYVYTQEADDLVASLHSMSDEARAGLNERRVEGLMNAANSLCGEGALDYETAEFYVLNHSNSAYASEAESKLLICLAQSAAAQGLAPDLEAAKDYVQSQGLVEKVIDAARTATALTIPVYESDGETVIGEYALTIL